MTSFWTDRQTFVYDRTLSDLLCKKECVLCWTNESIHIVFNTGLCTINGGAPSKFVELSEYGQIIYHLEARDLAIWMVLWIFQNMFSFIKSQNLHISQNKILFWNLQIMFFRMIYNKSIFWAWNVLELPKMTKILPFR